MRGYGENMEYVLAVFRSRNETLYLANMLKSNGYSVFVVNTPESLGQACGISVKFSKSILTIVKDFIRTKPFRAFFGFFLVKKENDQMSFLRV